MSNDTFIPRNGIPLFFPQDESCGFQASSGGLSRRKFLKRTGGATAATFIAWQSASQRLRATESNPSVSSELLMVCVVAPEEDELEDDTGKLWDDGVLVDYGLRAYYVATGPKVGEAVERGGSFDLSVDLTAQLWRDEPFTAGDEGYSIASVNPTESQMVLYSETNGIEFHGNPVEDPKSKPSGYGNGNLYGNVKFQSGNLTINAATDISTEIPTVNLGNVNIAGFPVDNPQFGASLEWSFTLMTMERYEELYGSDADYDSDESD